MATTEAARRAALQRAHDVARVGYERLRLSTSSLAVQEEARFALRYAYGLLRQFEGLPPRQTRSTPARSTSSTTVWSACTRQSDESWAPLIGTDPVRADVPLRPATRSGSRLTTCGAVARSTPTFWIYAGSPDPDGTAGCATTRRTGLWRWLRPPAQT